MLTKGRFNNMLNVTYNRNSSTSTNLYAYNTDIAGAAGIDGVSSDPFDWGIPSLSFTTVADLRDRTPSRRVDQRIQISNSTMRTWGRHAVRLGGEFRYMRLDSLSNSNPRGSFVFTGLYTSALANGRAVPGTGLDFADFLLGYAQQASVQYGPGDLKMRGRDWNLFLQDDWRLRGNLTLNYGLRYEYVSPYYEANNHLVNLDVNSDFTAAVPVDCRRHRRSSPGRCRRASSRPIATTLRRASAWPGARSRARPCAPATASTTTSARTGRSRSGWRRSRRLPSRRRASARRSCRCSLVDPFAQRRQLDDDELVRHRSRPTISASRRSGTPTSSAICRAT